MTIDQIREFCVIAKLGSFTKAAEYLYISQSALSRHMLDLEKSLNVHLIKRGNRVFGLTAAGETFYSEATTIIDSLEALVRKTQRTDSGKTGKLRLTVFESSMPYIFEQVCDFKRQHQEMDFEVDSNVGEEIVKSIISGDTDAGLIFAFDAPEKKALKTIPLGRDELCIVVPENHPFAERGSIQLADIREERVFLLKQNSVAGSNEMITQIENAIDTIPGKVICERVDDMVLHTRIGNGISIMSRVFAEERIKNCRLLTISDYDLSYDISLCWSEENTNPALGEFLKYYNV